MRFFQTENMWLVVLELKIATFSYCLEYFRKKKTTTNRTIQWAIPVVLVLMFNVLQKSLSLSSCIFTLGSGRAWRERGQRWPRMGGCCGTWHGQGRWCRGHGGFSPRCIGTLFSHFLSFCQLCKWMQLFFQRRTLSHFCQQHPRVWGGMCVRTDFLIHVCDLWRYHGHTGWSEVVI